MKVIKAEKLQDGTVTHEIENDDGTSETIRYKELRGGISWASVYPNGSAPHYFCILGAEQPPKPFEGQTPLKGKLRLISEYKSKSLMDMQEFFRKLTDDASRLSCYYFFADIREIEGEQSPYLIAINEYLSAQRIKPGISLQQAPFVDEFMFGIQQIKSLGDEQLIDIPNDTLAYEQLSRLQEKDISDFPEVRFFAVNALRHVVAQYFKSPASNFRGYTPPRQRIRPRRTWR